MSDDQDWRVEAELEGSTDHHGVLERVLGSVRDEYGGTAAEAQAAMGESVAITHDGHRLYGYANAEPPLSDARRAIEAACERHGLTAAFKVSHWDGELDRWRQVDPPESPAEAQATHAKDLEAEAGETQTVVCNVGSTLRASLEQAMSDWADTHGLECEIVEHPHLLTTQVAFTVTGPRYRIEEFRAALRADAGSSIRADGFGTGLI